MISDYSGAEALEEEYNKLSPELQEGFRQWINNEAIKDIPEFNPSVQEGKHTVLYDNRDSHNDSFVRFLFGNDYFLDRILDYPYFFDKSEKKEVIFDKKKTGIIIYTAPEISEINIASLDSALKPIWFRDITSDKKTKKYTKLSMNDLHETAKAYRQLFIDDITKFIEITYQAKENGIYVSFKINNFEIPPKVLNEKEFKDEYHKHTDRALYRGLSEDTFKREAHTLFKKLKEKGVSYNITKHNDQWFGPGVYWTENFEQAKKYGKIIVMGVAINDWYRTPLTWLDSTAQLFSKMFLMRDNECIKIRGKAVCAVPSNLLTEKQIQEYKKYDIVVLDAEEEIEKWLRCED